MKYPVLFLAFFSAFASGAQNTSGFISTNIVAPSAGSLTISYELMQNRENFLTGITLGASVFDEYITEANYDYMIGFDHRFFFGKKFARWFIGPQLRANIIDNDFLYYRFSPILPGPQPEPPFLYRLSACINQGIYFTISDKFRLSANAAWGILVDKNGVAGDAITAGINLHFKIH